MLSLITYFVANSHFGDVVHRLSGRKVFRHPEDEPDYIIPERYLQKIETYTPSIEDEDCQSKESATLSDNEYIIVDWHDPDDPQNPQNWPSLWKFVFAMQISYMTTAVYIAGPISSVIIPEIMENFDVGYSVATLPFAFYIFGYGLGPMIFSALSESPHIGRSVPYVYTNLIFTVLQIPTALSKSIGGMIVLRFIAGIFCSTPLATGAASYADVTPAHLIPAVFIVWGCSAFLGPALAPLIGTAVKESPVGWSMVFWFILALGGVSTLLSFFFLPESSANAILYQRALRLRKLTGNKRIVTQVELDAACMTKSQIAYDIFWRPSEVIIKEPMVLLMDIFQGLAYGMLFIWFEGIPIVFVEVYHFSEIQQTLPYIAIAVGVGFGSLLYLLILQETFAKKVLNNEPVQPEVFLDTSIIGTVLLGAGVFIFGWTSSPKCHWMGPVVGATVFGAGSVMVLQSNINYLARAFPKYVASVLAGNALARSAFGGAFPIFSRSLFINLSIDNFPVGWGSTVLGTIIFLMILIPVVYKRWGPQLRDRSKYST